MNHIAIPYLFLIFLAYAIQDGIRKAVKRAKTAPTRREFKQAHIFNK